MVNLVKYNLHWKENFNYGYDKERDLLKELIKYIDVRQIVGIIGLRRTGKTVLLKQTIDHLIKKGQTRDKIIYFSFDEEEASIEDVIGEFQSRIGVDISSAGQLYIFLDEIQKLEGWQNELKYYYDTYPTIKFFVSGSSSLFLKKKAEESLAGRIFLFNLPVLSFNEFLKFKGEEQLIRKPELFRDALKEQSLLYAKRQLPELIEADEPFITMYLESIVNKIIYEDLPKVFPIEYADALKRILRIVASNPGMITDYPTLASDLGINRKTLANYVSYLERGFLVQKCYNFSKNRLTTEKKMKRLYLTSTTLLFHLCENPDFGRAIENLVINSARAQFFWRRGTSEVDCVLVEDNTITPLECKYKDNIQRKEIKGLMKFLKHFSLKKGIVITKDSTGEEKIGDKKVIFIPLWKWLIQEG